MLTKCCLYSFTNKRNMLNPKFQPKGSYRRSETGPWIKKLTMGKVGRVDWLGKLTPFYVLCFCSPFSVLKHDVYRAHITKGFEM